jgi:hypothetical protein
MYIPAHVAAQSVTQYRLLLSSPSHRDDAANYHNNNIKIRNINSLAHNPTSITYYNINDACFTTAKRTATTMTMPT